MPPVPSLTGVPANAPLSSPCDFLVIPLAVLLLAGASQGTRKGSPEEQLPANIIAAHPLRRARLLVAGRQAHRLHGEELRRRLRSRRRHEDHPAADALSRTRAFCASQFLPNGDYFLIGARTFTDIQTTRSRDQEMWILKADAKPGDRPLALDHKISEGVAISKTVDEDRVVEHARPVSGPSAQGESVIYTADIVYEGGAAAACRTRRKSFARRRPSARSRRRTSAGTTPS